MADAEFVCANSACKVAETKRCVEGLDLNACPKFGKSAAPVEPPSDTGANGTELWDGEKLGLNAVDEVLRAHESRVIAVIGPIDAGKTTLVAALYDLFQRGPVGNWRFRRSR